MTDVAVPPGGIVTFLFTDIEDSSGLLERLGEACYQAVLEDHHRLLRAVFQSAGGYEIDTAGDGFFVSFRLASQALAAAVGAQRALAAHRWPQGATVRVRMGLHSGEAAPSEGDQTRGQYVHMHVHRAQRVSAAGHGGQILLSQATHGLVRDYLPEGMSLRDLGHYRLKGLPHPEQLFQVVVSDLSDQFPALSAELVATDREGSGESDPAGREAGGEQRVALLYRRRTQPDEELLNLLEARLRARGHSVFIDRHMTIGIEWAAEIERQLRCADAVVVLLSAASVESEMLQHEVGVAHEAAEREGRPRLLPVRIRYTGALPELLAAPLSRLQHTTWESHQDDERLAAELIHAVENPPALAPPIEPEALEPVGGAVPLASEFYVVRPVDEQFRAAIARRDSIVLVKGARQMGKTSLLARGLHQARQAGARVLTTDFQMLNAAQLQSADTLLRTLAQWIADQLDLEVLPEADWKPSRGPSMNFRRYLQREVLGKLDTPVVWGLDEVDRLFAYDFASEVFGMFRSWHNARSLEPDGLWSRLTLAIAYAMEAHLFITDTNQSPFNVGTPLTLADFTPAQVADLNGRYGAPLHDPRELERYYRLVGGNPYLVRRGLLEMATRQIGIEEIEARADRDEGIFGDHLKRLLAVLARDVRLCEAVRELLRGSQELSYDSFSRLRSAGVVVGETAREARLRCQLYATYLARHLG